MTITLWRITHARYQDTAYSGEGARRYGGRFNSAGRRVVYTSATLSLAILEFIANLDDYDPALLQDYVVVPATVDDRYVDVLPPSHLPADWREFPHAASTRHLGDRWLDERTSLLLAVPSAVVPSERNYLVNPEHPDFMYLSIGDPQDLDIDPRLLRSA